MCPQCKVMSDRRDSWLSPQKLYDTGGEDALREISRRTPNLHNRVENQLEERDADVMR
jgi:hypothetical protein